MTLQDAQAQANVLLAERGDEVIPKGYMKVGDAEQGEAEDMLLTSLAYKGYVRIWDTKTGVMSLQPKYLLWQTLRMTQEDGSLMYSPTDPHIPQLHGQDLFCPLNPSSFEYEAIADKGFKPCRKQHIPYQDAVDSHLMKKHKRGYAALQRSREDRIREEDRNLQRESIESNNRMIAAMAGKVVTQAPLYVSDKPKRGRPSK